MVQYQIRPLTRWPGTHRPRRKSPRDGTYVAFRKGTHRHSIKILCTATRHDRLVHGTKKIQNTMFLSFFRWNWLLRMHTSLSSL